MATIDHPENRILNCWQTNALPWVQAIEQGQIASRVDVTNQAILNTVLALTPASASVLDIGCGEGWLTDALERQGISTVGIDATPALLAHARQHRRGDFRLLAYEELTPDNMPEQFDLAVCNFSLIGKDSTKHVIASISKLLKPNGHFVVQTLHPLEANGLDPYQDGWREGSWQGFGEQFSQPSPWYFRTMETWMALFHLHGLKDVNTTEPMNPQTQKMASVIFTAQKKG